MTLLTVATFLALLALVAAAGSIGLVALSISARLSGGASPVVRILEAAVE